MQSHEDIAREQQQQQQQQSKGRYGRSNIPMDTLLQDVVLSLLFAGYDTTSIGLTYALYLITQHSDVRRHILDELDAVGGGGAAFLDNDARRLVYTRAVIQETLRLYPPAYVTLRKLQHPLTLAGDLVFSLRIGVWLVALGLAGFLVFGW